MKRCIIFVVAITAIIGVGCTKHCIISFTNKTANDLQVTMEGPGDIYPDPPSLPIHRDGGDGIFKIAVPSSLLPADYQWRADSQKGTVVIQKESPDQAIAIK
jgi:hypothetical protein